jgi:hypothetical protein
MYIIVNRINPSRTGIQNESAALIETMHLRNADLARMLIAANASLDAQDKVRLDLAVTTSAVTVRLLCVHVVRKHSAGARGDPAED